MSCRSSIPENFIFGPKAAEGNDAADRQPTGQEGPVSVGHVLPEIAHLAHEVVVEHDRRDRHEESRGRREERLGHPRRDHRRAGGPGARHVMERAHDAPHRSEKSDQRRRVAHGAQESQVLLELHPLLAQHDLELFLHGLGG